MNIDEIANHMQCVACGQENAYVLNTVEKTITEDDNTVIVSVTVGECIYCGEQIMDLATEQRLEAAREQLQIGDMSQFVPVGITYRTTS